MPRNKIFKTRKWQQNNENNRFRIDSKQLLHNF